MLPERPTKAAFRPRTGPRWGVIVTLREDRRPARRATPRRPSTTPAADTPAGPPPDHEPSNINPGPPSTLRARRRTTQGNGGSASVTAPVASGRSGSSGGIRVSAVGSTGVGDGQ